MDSLHYFCTADIDGLCGINQYFLSFLKVLHESVKYSILQYLKEVSLLDVLFIFTFFGYDIAIEWFSSSDLFPVLFIL